MAGLTSSSVEPQRDGLWHFLYVTVRHGTLPSPTTERLDEILSRLDIDATIASDHLLLIPLIELSVRHRSDHESVAAQIYRWADGVDTGDRPTPAFREQFGADATHVFSTRLIDWLHTLAARHPEDPDGEFARLPDGLIQRSRILAAELRGPLTNIVRHMPFSRHRALRRTLLAARARPTLEISEAPPEPAIEKQRSAASRRKRRKKRGPRGR